MPRHWQHRWRDSCGSRYAALRLLASLAHAIGNMNIIRRSEVGDRLNELRERVADAARRSGRGPESIRLVGVSKGQPAELIAAALEHGLIWVGENYIQEAKKKRAEIESSYCCPSVGWLGIGRLQSNKAGDAVAVFDGVESVDRFSLAQALDHHAHRAQRVIEVLIQVNVSAETQKGGVSEQECEHLLAQCALLSSVRVRGLMTVPAVPVDAELSRPAFARLRSLRDRLRSLSGGEDLTELSMGMSRDFEVAIEEGATRIRIGTALFGAR
jgi:PLP dependent protein